MLLSHYKSISSMLQEGTYWKIIFGAAATLLGYQVYRDYSDYRQNTEREKEAFKICLTGGPCGGKTEGISWVYSLFQQKNIPAFIVPEAATILGSGGALLNFMEYTSDQMVDFQYSLMKVQRGLEDIITNISNIRCATKPIILCDRGLLDGKAYLPQELWQQMLDQHHLREADMIKRYEMVVHMVTTADGVPEEYQNSKNREETIEQAIDIDRKLREAWASHPNLQVVTNDFMSTFDQKKAVLVAIITKYVDVKGYQPQRKVSQMPEEMMMYLLRKQKLHKRRKEKIERKNSC